MKGYKYEFNGTEYTLCYTGEAFFAISEIVGDEEITKALIPETREGFAKLCEAAAVMSEQGELVKRHLGYEPAEMLDAEQIRMLLPPTERVNLYNAVMATIILGCEREISEKSKEISLTRQKMLKKKE